MFAGRRAPPVATELSPIVIPSGRRCSGADVFFGGKEPAPLGIPHFSQPILDRGILNSRAGRSVGDLRPCLTRNSLQSSQSVTRRLCAAQDFTGFLLTALSLRSAAEYDLWPPGPRVVAALGDQRGGALPFSAAAPRALLDVHRVDTAWAVARPP
jgi:hypothetical protein